MSRFVHSGRGEDELRGATRLALVRGGELYAAGLYFEAHAAWEEAWLAESGDVRRLLHGLILIAAGLVKAFRDRRPGGAAKHLGAAAALLATLPGEMAGVRVVELRAELALAVEAARRWRDGGPNALHAPMLQIPGGP